MGQQAGGRDPAHRRASALAAGHEAIRVPIGRATLADAVRIGDYFAEHARAAFGLLGTTGTSDAHYVLEHLRRKGTKEFTVRDLHTELPRGRFGTVEPVAAAVGVLEHHGYLLAVHAPDRSGPGRKPSPKYQVQHVPTESAESTQ